MEITYSHPPHPKLCFEIFPIGAGRTATGINRNKPLGSVSFIFYFLCITLFQQYLFLMTMADDFVSQLLFKWNVFNTPIQVLCTGAP